MPQSSYLKVLWKSNTLEEVNKVQRHAPYLTVSGNIHEQLPLKSILIWTFTLLTLGYGLHQFQMIKQRKLSSEVSQIEERIKVRESIALWMSDSSNSLELPSSIKPIRTPNGIPETLYLIDSLESVAGQLAEITSYSDGIDSTINSLIIDINRPLANEQIALFEKQIYYAELGINTIITLSIVYLIGIIFILFKRRKNTANKL